MTKTFSHVFAAVGLALACLVTVSAQRQLGVRATGSGGPLLTEQAAYDVKAYDLKLRVNMVDQSIAGALTAHILIVHPMDWFVLDLDAPLRVERVEVVSANNQTQQPLRFERREGRLWISLPMTKQPGEAMSVRIDYGGKPRVAPRPPWVGGFVWSKTKSGDPWLGVACQTDGADLWFPVKDHPSDEPDRVNLSFTVPQPLVAASNGTLESVVKNEDGTQTFNWLVRHPINNYGITLNVAPYRTIEVRYTSISGDTIPLIFWVLPEDLAKGQTLVKETEKYLRFFEEHLGPYPFRTEKIGIAQTRYLGMENQTIIAYGNNFQFDSDGLDWLMFHELGHEWWGNMVTASDWRDFWLHEGFQSFMDTFYLEKLRGRNAYLKGMSDRVRGLRNMQPVAPRESRTTVQMYMAAPDYVNSDGDIYGKGAVILHTLRYLIGDKAFFTALRRMAYPELSFEKVKDGRQVRFATTDDFLKITEAASGMDLDWFFDVYLRQPKLPKLMIERGASETQLWWDVPEQLPFPMPLEVQIGNEKRRYDLNNGRMRLPIAAAEKVAVDPEGWILKDSID